MLEPTPTHETTAGFAVLHKQPWRPQAEDYLALETRLEREQTRNANLAIITIALGLILIISWGYIGQLRTENRTIRAGAVAK